MRAARALLVLAIAGWATACGISSHSRPEILPGGIVTPALAPPSGAPGVPAAGSRTARIFFVSDTRVVDVARVAPAGGLDPALELLLEGPTEAELAAGIRSAIADGTRLRSARVEDGTATVDLSGAFVELGGEEQILAVAQLVLTATAVPGVERVRLVVDGDELEVPRADGTLVRAPLRADDYATLRTGGR